jgi:Holliday junction DNA helicase RuvB
MDGSAVPAPSNLEERGSNPLRPTRLARMIGQERTRALLKRVISSAMSRNVPLDHVLLVGGSGLGKTTLGNIIANEIGVLCYQVEAPISHDTLLALREVMRDKDVLMIDEIHQQAIMERRGKTSSTQPEVLYQVLEDRSILTDAGVLPYPAITVIGATTDEGMLPDPFINRFPLRPVLEPYSTYDLAQIAMHNAEALGVPMGWDAAYLFAGASRGVPRQINNYVRNGAMLASRIDEEIAHEVLAELNRVTLDGLTLDMQKILVFLATRAKRTNGDGEITYQASVNTLATAIGKARDTKAVQLRIEPYLIERGFLQVGHGGRKLTDEGLERAVELQAAGVA